jgi:putative transposase
MQLRSKTPKRRVKAKLREDRQEAVGPNDVWAMDFVHDQLANPILIPLVAQFELGNLI